MLGLDVKKLKCECCRCYDEFDGCMGFDCQYDFELSMSRVSEVAAHHHISNDTLVGLIMDMVKEQQRKEQSDTCVLPDDFDPADSDFRISQESDMYDRNFRLIELDRETLERLRAEINFILDISNT